MIYCFYHNDLDGHCAGAIVKRAHPEAIMHEIAYGYDFQENVLDVLAPSSNTIEVVIVDFRFVAEEILELLSTYCDKITWIDHHASSIEEEKHLFTKAAKEGISLEGLTTVLEVGKSGCELAWEYYNPYKPIYQLCKRNPAAMPRAVRLIGRWDVWDHSDPRTIPFNEGLSISWDTDPAKDMEAWDAMFADQLATPHSAGTIVDMILSVGHSANKGKIRYDDFINRAAYYLPDWNGKRTVAINAICKDSYVIDEDDERFAKYKPEVLVWYYQTPKGAWKYSLRSYPGTDTVVSEIAKNYCGGGGHASSAGFISDDLLIKPEV